MFSCQHVLILLKYPSKKLGKIVAGVSKGVCAFQIYSYALIWMIDWIHISISKTGCMSKDDPRGNRGVHIVCRILYISHKIFMNLCTHHLYQHAACDDLHQLAMFFWTCIEEVSCKKTRFVSCMCPRGVCAQKHKMF